MKKYYGLIKFALMSLCYEMAIYLIAIKVGIDEYAAKFLTIGAYFWFALFYYIFHSRRMKRIKRMENMADSIVNDVMNDLYKNPDKYHNTLDPYRFVNNSSEDDGVDFDYMNTLEYKYEVLDSLSIRQIEKYLEIRKNASRMWWL